MEDRIKQLENDLAEMKEMLQKTQQVTFPIDESSVNAISAGLFVQYGVDDLTETKSLSGDAQNITVPAPYSGWFLTRINGSLYKIPYL